MPIADVKRDPVLTGVTSLEPAVEWYALYKHAVRGRRDGAALAERARTWLITTLEDALDADDVLDPLDRRKISRKQSPGDSPHR